MSDFVADIDVRFSDLDPMGHVNNATYASYLEQARARYFQQVVGVALADVDTVLARLEIDFERPIEWGEAVEVAIEVDSLGRSSIPMAYEVTADGERAATAETVQVLVDRESGRSRELPEDLREAIAGFHGFEA